MKLGLDVGTKRVGTALSNSGSKIATPFKTFSRGGGNAEREILALIAEKDVSELIVGLPLDDSGKHTYQCQDIEKFARRLCRRSKLELTFVDEYLSSQEASERLSLGGRNFNGKTALDSAAAAVILQSYIDREN